MAEKWSLLPRQSFLRDNKRYHDAHLQPCGLVVAKECSFLGASPDAKVCMRGQSGIMDIKCLYYAQNYTIDEACDSLRNFFLIRSGGRIKLDQRHGHYDQVQGQLMITWL